LYREARRSWRTTKPPQIPARSSYLEYNQGQRTRCRTALNNSVVGFLRLAGQKSLSLMKESSKVSRALTPPLCSALLLRKRTARRGRKSMPTESQSPGHRGGPRGVCCPHDSVLVGTPIRSGETRTGLATEILFNMVLRFVHLPVKNSPVHPLCGFAGLTS